MRPKMAINATVAPIVKLPVSPQNIFAGYLLNQKKAKRQQKRRQDITKPGNDKIP